MSSPDAAPTPNIAEIPLPPGMTLPQFLELQGDIVTIAITVAVAFALLAWDYFVLLSDELALYRSADKKTLRSPGFIAFVILRYAGILALLPGLWFTSVQSDHCQLAASLSQAGVVLVTACSGIIFCYRIAAIWHNNRLVYGIVGTLYLGMIGCWIATATQLRALNGPPTNFGSNCQMQPVPSWSPIGFASSVIFDTVVLILGLLRLHGNVVGTSKVSRQIYQDNIMYFLLVTCTNIVVLAIQSLPSSYDLVKPNALPYATLITYAMGSRVFLNLRLFNRRQQRKADAEAGINLSSGTHSTSYTSRSHQPGNLEVKVVQSQHSQSHVPTGSKLDGQSFVNLTASNNYAV